MPERAKSRKAGPPRGVLPQEAPDGEIEHERLLPSEPLLAFVAHFWWVRWSLRSPFTAETLPHPTVHLLFEHEAHARRAVVSGVHTGRFSRQLADAGYVFGIKFRPATFQALVGTSMSSLTNRTVPLELAFGPDAAPFEHAMLEPSPCGPPDFHAKIALAEAFLAPRLPPLPPENARVRDLVERMATDRALLRGEDAGRLLDLDLRTLQRRFQKLVGVGPKWVIQRYRLHEAAEQLKGPSPPSLATLAAQLGYFDQAHFAHDFRELVGYAPGRFGARARRPA